MRLLLHREFDSGEDTLGRLYYRDHYMDLRYVYTLEDTYHEKKIPGETRIPEGFYDVQARKFGRIYDMFVKSSIEIIRSFTQKWGVLEIMNVPDYEGILFHSGNITYNSAFRYVRIYPQAFQYHPHRNIFQSALQ